jgi:subtilisin family serine protease
MLRRLLVLAATLSLALAAAPVAAGPGDAAAHGGGAWHRVQFADRIDTGALAVLPDTPRQYVPHDAYVTWLTTAQSEAVAAAAAVADVTALPAAAKRSPALAGASGIVRVEATVLGGTGRALSEAVLAHGGAEVDRYDAQADGELETVVVDVPAAALDRLAARASVLHLSPTPLDLQPEDEGTAQILAGGLDGFSPIPGYRDFLDGVELDGEGVTISILDTGVDDRHPDLAGRVTHVEYGVAPVVGEPVDSNGHGTHVAGIAAGDPAANPGIGRVRDRDGLLYGQGIAPAASIVAQNAIATTRAPGSFPQGGWPGLTADAVRAGAVAWNASLTSGEGTGVGYIASARAMDVLTRDGDLEAEGEQPITLVWSAGNSGPRPSTLTAPKEAKNIIAVGATQSHRAGSIESMAGFSSRGPAIDGRILPHVVAPGQTVASANALPANALTALCLGPPRDSFGLYIQCSGTSMSAPHVTGSVALTTQWWRGMQGSDPSPAMHKALLVNTATDLELTEPIPNNDEGWGRVNLAALFDPQASRIYVDEEVVLGGLDETWTMEAELVDPTQPLKVTLAWTDAPGAPDAAPALVNDLDLVVEGPDGLTFLGNVFAGGRSTDGGTPDRLNNLENVYVDGPAGSYRITVRAANLPAAAVPGAATEVSQDFALVVSNAR